jgi:hypothetical protein
MLSLIARADLDLIFQSVRAEDIERPDWRRRNDQNAACTPRSYALAFTIPL